MPDEWIQAFGHLNAHERLLQVVFVSTLVNMQEAEARAYCAELVAISRSVSMPRGANPVHAERHGLQIARDGTALLERFLERALASAATHRAARLT